MAAEPETPNVGQGGGRESRTAGPESALRRGLLGIVVLGLVVMFAAGAAAGERPEHEVKAAFVYNFGKYVRWPEGVREADSVFVIAILGDDPFGPALDEIARGNRIHDRPVAVKRVSHLSELDACEVLFISASEEARLDAILAELPGKAILTVSDMPDFVDRGGMIGLVISNRHVQFDVNLEAAERAGLAVGSQLLRLARGIMDSKAR